MAPQGGLGCISLPPAIPAHHPSLCCPPRFGGLLPIGRGGGPPAAGSSVSSTGQGKHDKEDIRLVLKAVAELDSKLESWFSEATATWRPATAEHPAHAPNSSLTCFDPEPDHSHSPRRNAHVVGESESIADQEESDLEHEVSEIVQSAAKFEDLSRLVPRTPSAAATARRAWHMVAKGSLIRKSSELASAATPLADDAAAAARLIRKSIKGIRYLSYRKTYWDAVGVLLLAIDTVLVPLSIAWDGAWTDLTGLAILALVFWTVDMVFSLFCV